MSTTTLALSFRMFQNGQLIGEHALTQGVIKIGKVASAHLQIDDPAVSRMHAIIEVTDGEVSLIDLGSSGTFVNARRINKAKLASGDVITLGDTRLELTIGDPVPVRRAPPPLPGAARRAAPGTSAPASSADAASAAAPAVPAARAATPARGGATRSAVLAPGADRASETVSGTITSAGAASSPSARRATTPVGGSATVVSTAVCAAGTDRGSETASGTLTSTSAAAAAEAIAVERAGRALPGARAVEVAAMLGDTVLGVKHCADPRSARPSPLTWGLLAGGAVSLVAAALVFGLSLRTAAANEARLDRWTRIEGKPAHAFRPVMLGPDADWIALGGLALGIAGIGLGLARRRGERASPYYRIGTAPGVDLATQAAPAAAFPLIAPSGDALVFHYGAGIDGELLIGATATPLAELAAAGRARPSATVAGALELAIPPDARIRARAGRTTFLISAIAPPRRDLTAWLAGHDRRALGYVAGSLALHLGLVGLVLVVPPAPAGINFDPGLGEDLGVMARITAAEDRLPERGDASGGGADGTQQGADSVGMALPAGTAGAPDGADGRRQIARRNREPQLTLAEALDRARYAGILGSEYLERGFETATASDYTSGFDDSDYVGPLAGADGNGRGTFGSGPRGDALGGGSCAIDCGTVGTGRYRTIGPGRHTGYGFGPAGAGGRGWGVRGVAVPRVGEPVLGGSYDKSIVRRYIRRHLNEIGYCYDKQLLARPGIAGEATVRFFITPTGSVQGASGAGFDREVADCLADVIAHIAFPPPGDGGVQVSYPFQFHTTGR